MVLLWKELLVVFRAETEDDDTAKICRSILYLVASYFTLRWEFTRADHLRTSYFILPLGVLFLVACLFLSVYR